MRRLASLAAALTLAAPVAQAATVAVTADRMIDVATGARIERPQVIITDGRIIQVGRQGDAIPAGAERIDLPGVTLTPGLIDMHVHITSSPLYGGYNSLLFTDSFWTAIGVAHAKSTLQAGFTTIRNVGSEGYGDVGLKQAIDAGFVPGPRIVPAAYALGATGGHCDSTFFPPSMNEQSPAVIDSPDEARRMVRKMRKYGAEVIKICATGGVFSRGSSPGAQQMTLAEMQAVVDEAHAAGMKVAAHAHGASGIRQAIEAGVDTIEHVSLVDDEGIRLAVRKGAWFAMDIYNTDYTQAEGAKNGVLEENLQKDRDIGLIQRQNFQKALRAGVKMVYATDAGVYPHGDNAKQFAVMVQWGATPLQALQSATLNAAEALGQSGQVGQVKAGAWGDLVGVKGDPLSDVKVLEAPVFVMKAGETVRRP
ncbi:metal-dependent hydrolase family protein [Phenylobacterium parvum]|uniref:Xaa-Pro dipeptidase n=1 Tax=Phenylobacterium parvum TaxID=2201350 RepID=A0A2Z3HVS8_9CAUL|nr:amidohydrolase family protein [Phenylobacterium parvum]AWM78326.1 Xaa-Pro dipeptidase [Phenylobacterium parvum]